MNLNKRNLNIHEKFIITVWSVLLNFLALLLRFFAIFKPELRRILKKNIDSQTTYQLMKLNANCEQRDLFFCSSAGEYEQALPLIERLQKRNHSVQIVFFSPSGIDFASKRLEKTFYFLTPLDTIYNWYSILQAISPQNIFVIRHEIWPAFMMTAFTFGKVHLINASSNRIEHNSKLSLFLKKFLYKYFDSIDLVNSDQKDFYAKSLRLQEYKIFISGDTKYDRVYERALNSEIQSTDLKEDIHSIFPNKKKLIVGSAWLEDLKQVVPSYLHLKSEKDDFSWRMIVAPHDLDQNYLDKIYSYFKEQGLRFLIYSDLTASTSTPHKDYDILLIDKMGLLGEFYSCANLAYVGGANHNKVHNVLEPAAYGLPIAFGSRYENSAEAVLMVEQNFATVAFDSQSITNWWQKHAGSSDDQVKDIDFIAKNKGAADKIIKRIYDRSHVNNKKVR